MEGLAGAAGVMAVGSITIQLADQFKKLHDFWISFKDAPEDIRAVIVELKSLLGVLKQIQLDEAECGLDSMTVDLLHSCEDQVRIILDIVTELEPGFASQSRRTRVLSAMKATFRQEKLKKCRELLRDTKSTLMLAQQNQARRMIYAQHVSRDQHYATIIQKLAALEVQCSSQRVLESPPAAACVHQPHSLPIQVQDVLSILQEQVRASAERETQKGDEGKNSCSPPESYFEPFKKKSASRRQRTTVVYAEESFMANLFGSITVRTETFKENIADDPESEEDPSGWKGFLRIRPALWLIRLGLRRGLEITFQKSVQGWQHGLKTFGLIPHNSDIFECCLNGDIDGVKALLSSGRASVWDCDSEGYTPLHLAAGAWNAELCKLLLQRGAHPTTATYKDNPRKWFAGCTPAALAVSPAQRSPRPGETFDRALIDTLRLFLDEIDFEEPESQGWLIIKTLLHLTARPCEDHKSPGFVLGEVPYSEHTAFCHCLKWILSALGPAFQFQSTESIFSLCVPRADGQRYLHMPGLFELSVTGDIVEYPDVFARPGGTFLGPLYGPGASCLSAQICMGGSADLHRPGFGASKHGVGDNETPLSLAMRSEWTFYLWLSALTNSEVDAGEHLDRASREPSLTASGWTETGLLMLFEYGASKDAFQVRGCHCCAVFYEVPYPIELGWQRELEFIKAYGNSIDRRDYPIELGSQRKLEFIKAYGNSIDRRDKDHYQRPMSTSEDNQVEEYESCEEELPERDLEEAAEAAKAEAAKDAKDAVDKLQWQFARKGFPGKLAYWVCGECWNSEDCRRGHCSRNQVWLENWDRDGDSNTQDDEVSPYLLPVPCFHAL